MAGAFNMLQGRFGLGGPQAPGFTPPIMPGGPQQAPPTMGRMTAQPPRKKMDWAMLLASLGDGARALQGMPQGNFAQGLIQQRMMMEDRQRQIAAEQRGERMEDARFGREQAGWGDQDKAKADDQAAKAGAIAEAQRRGDPGVIARVQNAPTGAAAWQVLGGRDDAEFESSLQVRQAEKLGDIQTADQKELLAYGQTLDAEKLRLQADLERAQAEWAEGRPEAQMRVRLLRSQIAQIDAETKGIRARTAALGRQGGGPAPVAGGYTDLPQ